MTSIREQILTVLDERLSAIGGIGEYERDPSGDPTDWPAVALIDDGDDVSEDQSGLTEYAMGISIEAFAIGSGGLAVSRQLNELHAEIVKAVMQEPPIGGLAERFEEGALKRFTAELASKPRKGIRKDFTIFFTTRRGDPASQ